MQEVGLNDQEIPSHPSSPVNDLDIGVNWVIFDEL